MKPFYSTNRLLSAHRARPGRPFILSTIRWFAASWTVNSVAASPRWELCASVVNPSPPSGTKLFVALLASASRTTDPDLDWLRVSGFVSRLGPRICAGRLQDLIQLHRRTQRWLVCRRRQPAIYQKYRSGHGSDLHLQLDSQRGRCRCGIRESRQYFQAATSPVDGQREQIWSASAHSSTPCLTNWSLTNRSKSPPKTEEAKSVGISRVGSSSDVAARVLLKALGLEPDKDMPILQVGGSRERAASFRTGRITGFTSPPVQSSSPKGMPSPHSCQHGRPAESLSVSLRLRNDDEELFGDNHSTVKRIMMALIDGTHFSKTQKRRKQEDLCQILAPKQRGYLEAGYQANAKLFERVPFVTKGNGMEIQIKEALARKPGATLKVNEIVDDSIVVELEKEGFVDRIYK